MSSVLFWLRDNSQQIMPFRFFFSSYINEMQTDTPVMKDSMKLLTLVLDWKLSSQGCCIYLFIFTLFSYFLFEVFKCDYKNSELIAIPTQL